jgi:hypothetical protein
MALTISSLPNEILAFSLRLLVNGEQQQILNTPASWPPAPTSNPFTSILRVSKAWCEAAQPPLWAEVSSLAFGYHSRPGERHSPRRVIYSIFNQLLPSAENLQVDAAASEMFKAR